MTLDPDHHPKVVKNFGVDPELGGYQRLRIRGFRGYCADCGALGALRENYLTAQHDRDVHRNGQPFPVARR